MVGVIYVCINWSKPLEQAYGPNQESPECIHEWE